MSRRIKLTITAIFLVLLAIPVTYIALTWHPPNPLRFIILEERVEKHQPGDVNYHWMRMELQNTSDVTVVFWYGIFLPKQGYGAGMPHPFQKVGVWEGKSVVIPPRGTTVVDFDTRILLSLETIEKIQAGKKPAREGSIEYSWLSPPRARYEEAYAWLSPKLPGRWLQDLLWLEPCTDATDVESHSPQETPAPDRDAR
jgi:hypothetical protein